MPSISPLRFSARPTILRSCASPQAAESLLVGSAPHLAGLRVDQWAEIVTVLGSVAYLYRTRHRHGPDVIAPPPLPSGAGQPAGSAHGAPSAS